MQNDFVSGTLANQHNAEAIVPVINGMREAFDLVVISLDWHPHQHCSFVETANDVTPHPQPCPHTRPHPSPNPNPNPNPISPLHLPCISQGHLLLEGRLGPDPNNPMQPAPPPTKSKPAVPYQPFESVKLCEDADR